MVFTRGVADRGGAVLATGGGRLILVNSEFRANAATEPSDPLDDRNSVGGGAVLAVDHDVLIRRSVLEDNNAAGSGGAIRSVGGELTVDQSELRANSAGVHGGAVAVSDGRLIAHDSTFGGPNATDANIATGDQIDDSVINGSVVAAEGGAIRITGDTFARLQGSVVQNNRAEYGGGIAVGPGATLQVIQGSTIAENSLADRGELGARGGGIYSRGIVALADSSVAGNSAAVPEGFGGGIFSTTLVTLTRSRVSANTAVHGGGILIDFGRLNIRSSVVGGPEVADGNRSLAIVGENDPSNFETGSGAGIGSFASIVRIDDSTLQNNRADLSGGGIYTTGSSVVYLTRGSVVRDNAAAGASLPTDPSVDPSSRNVRGGGGIYQLDSRLNNFNETLAVADSTITDNSADDGSGGGILGFGGRVTLTRSQVLRNFADRSGGGLEVIDGILKLRSATAVTDNRAGTATQRPEEGPQVAGLQVAGPQAAGPAANISELDPGAGAGGGVSVRRSGLGTSVATIRDSIVDNNVATRGGGLWGGGGTSVRLIDSTVAGNVAEDGGGAWNDGGTLVLTRTTLDANASQLDRTSPEGSGGGVLSTGGLVVANDSTFTGNRAGLAGGGLRATGGEVRVDRSTFGDNGSFLPRPGELVILPLQGGAISLSGPTLLRLSNSELAENFADDGSGLYIDDGAVAAITTTSSFRFGLFNDGGVVSISRSEFDGGSLTNSAGRTNILNGTTLTNTAVGVAGGRVDISDSTLSDRGFGLLSAVGNSTEVYVRRTSLTGLGMAPDEFSQGDSNIVAAEGARLSLTDVSVSDGFAFNGGGLTARSGAFVTINRATFAGNTAESSGGAISVRDEQTVLNMVNSTVSGNVVETDIDSVGSGIHIDGGTVDIASSTIAYNRFVGGGSGAGLQVSRFDDVRRVRLDNTLVIANNARDDGQGFTSFSDVEGSLDPDSSHNLIGAGFNSGLTNGQNGNNVDDYSLTDSDGFFPSPDDVLDPELADNGGFALTHALPFDSVAIDAGDEFEAVIEDSRQPLAVDQTGQDRVSNFIADIGAVEFQFGF